MGVGGISLPWDEKAMNHELLCCLKLCLADGFMRAHDWHLVLMNMGRLLSVLVLVLSQEIMCPEY